MADRRFPRQPGRDSFSTELEMTFEHPLIPGRFVNVPTVEPRTGTLMSPLVALLRAQQLGLLGFGFPSEEVAIEAARRRSRSIPSRDVERSQEVRSQPFNPGGQPPGDIVRATLLTNMLLRQAGMLGF